MGNGKEEGEEKSRRQEGRWVREEGEREEGVGGWGRVKGGKGERDSGVF